MSFDNQLLEKYNVKLISNECTTYDIINDFLNNNQSEQPFYIIDLGEIIKLYEKWLNCFPNIKPYYAVKCNPNPVILEVLEFLGTNFDCASENEIKSVIKLTDDPNKIIFANPCKMSSQIKYARANDVDMMTFDCEEELYKIKLYHPYSKLVLRLAVDDSKSICQFNSKFGCKIENIENLINLMKILKLKMIGFSFHVGSGCKSVESYYNAIKTCREAYDLAVKNNIHISIIDIGGGFPGVYSENSINIEQIAEKITQAQQDFFSKEIEEDTIKFIAEPGRYFVEKSHTLVLNVIGKKRETYINNDTNQLEEIIIYYLNDGVYGSFNCIYFDHKKPCVLPFNERNEKILYKSKIFGPTCDSIDLITEEIMLPELAIGEWVYVENFGAYTTASSSSFNGFITTDYKYILRNYTNWKEK
jgi:ornithine decarboxylase